ncbi:unnamed protein product [Angiostrongylus costaricensis]|uniref:CPSF73-100_C domain-containing protein n=1 Tax=Angiostrongylus costaricensis TaxID=334426 RepID=A0A0R3Q031_ANGCS|nr:unnamed protein product [Angiostrongylus costaricensis]
MSSAKILKHSAIDWNNSEDCEQRQLEDCTQFRFQHSAVGFVTCRELDFGANGDDLTGAISVEVPVEAAEVADRADEFVAMVSAILSLL